MKKLDGLNGYSLLEDIEKANKREDLRVLLGVILGSTTLLSLGHLLSMKEGQAFGEIENKAEYIINVVKNNLGISSVLAILLALRTKMISSYAKIRLEEVVDALERDENVFVSLDTLVESSIKLNENLTEEDTKVTDIQLEDMRGNQVKLREYTDGDFSEVYFIDSKNEEHKLLLRQKQRDY